MLTVVLVTIVVIKHLNYSSSVFLVPDIEKEINPFTAARYRLGQEKR